MTEQFGQTDAVIKHMIRDIMGQCDQSGHTVSETLVAFMVKAVVLNPENEFDVDRPLGSFDVTRLTQLCTNQLTDTTSIALDTIKMQVYFDINYTSRSTFIGEHRDVHAARLKPLLQEILDARSRTRDELESLYRRIVAYDLALSGLGSSTDMAVLRETTAALQSVLPQSELGTMIRLSRDDKVKQMRELAYIVFGIRLFNMHIGKGGAGIPDLLDVMERAVPEAHRKIQEQFEVAAPSSYRYTAILERHGKSGALQDLESTLSLQLAEAAANCRQHMAYLELLKFGVEKCGEVSGHHMRNYRSQAEDLRRCLKSKQAVPTSDVFPKFRELAKSWAGLQEELVLLGVLATLTEGLLHFTKVREEQLNVDALGPYLEGIEVLTDEERVAKTSVPEGRIDEMPAPNVEVFHADKVSNFASMQTEYKGFCALSVAAGEGVPVPGNPLIGIVRYRDKCYCFSSKEAAQAFCHDPARCVAMVMQIARRRPVLIQLLGLHSHFSSMTPSRQGELDGRLISKPVTKCDAGMQTDVHAPVPEGKGIVKSYEWNEWELRRKALSLANLRDKVTKSTQTVDSGYRRHVETQIYLPRTQETQTMREKHTDIPKPAVYMTGLRGSTEHTQQPIKIDLTPTVHTHVIAEDMQPKNH